MKAASFVYVMNQSGAVFSELTNTGQETQYSSTYRLNLKHMVTAVHGKQTQELLLRVGFDPVKPLL